MTHHNGRKRGRCPKCGYTLKRAFPDGGLDAIVRECSNPQCGYRRR